MNIVLFKLYSLPPFAPLPTFIGRIGHPTASLKRVGLIIWICALVILAITLRLKDDKCNHNQTKKIKCVCLFCRHCFQKIHTVDEMNGKDQMKRTYGTNMAWLDVWYDQRTGCFTRELVYLKMWRSWSSATPARISPGLARPAPWTPLSW